MASTKKRSQPRRVHPPAVEEVRAIAAHCATIQPALGVSVHVAAWSGLRVAEVARLEWQHIRFQEGQDWAYIDVVAGKGRDGGRDRTAILLAEGVEQLQRLAGPDARGARTPLFVRPMNTPEERRNGCRGNWAAGAQHDRKTLYQAFCKGRDAIGQPQFVFHDLRKFFATYLLNAGVSEQDVAVALGHLDKYGRPNVELVQKVYGFVNVDKALRRAVEVSIGERVGAAIQERARPAAAPRGVVESQLGAVLSGAAEARPASSGYVFRSRPGSLPGSVGVDDVGEGRVAGVAEVRVDQDAQRPAGDFRSAIDHARRAHRASAQRAAPAGGLT